MEAACSDPLRGVITVVDRDDRQLFHLTAVGADHTATLQPGVVSPWLIETFTAGVLVSRCEVHDADLAAALGMGRAGLLALAAREPGTGTTPCDECDWPITDDAPSVIDPSHAPSCSLHPWATSTR